MGALSELRGMGIEMKGVMGKEGCQRGDGRMKHLLLIWRGRRSRPWTHGEG